MRRIAYYLNYQFSIMSHLSAKLKSFLILALICTIGISVSNAQSIAWSGKFVEVSADDGSVSGSRTATLSSETFTVTSGNLTEGVHFNVNLPAGLTVASFAVDGAGHALRNLPTTDDIRFLCHGKTRGQ